MANLASIRELPEEVIHKIAAGEVVERPVSVVKELVENALDAGATRIQVSLEKGGIEKIVVADNGHGIDPQQLPLALKRHATSKIAQAEDLFSLNSLGFRGEALPAIASVSEFQIQSATAQTAPLGYCLKVREGKASPVGQLPRNQGTQVSVEKLFCTTPARKKFLKRPETEWGHCSDLLTAMALGRLDVEFEVKHNEKKFLTCPVATDPRQRALDLFGKEAMEQLFPLEREVSEVGLWGLIGHPNFSKKSNRHLYVYVNGRYVQDRLLNHAIVSGYRSLLMTGQYPFAILHLNLAPGLVDVNVHPTKREVKFSNGNAIHHLVSETIAKALERAPWKDSGPGTPVREKGIWSQEQKRRDTEPASFNRGEWRALYQPSKDQVPATRSQAPVASIGTLPFQKLQLIGQFNLTYLICEHEGSLILIDQHAAHERIGFEKLKSAYESGGFAQQALLTPLTFEQAPMEGEKLRRHLEDFRDFGFDLEDFGNNTFVLKAHPALLSKGNMVSLIRELLDEMEACSPKEPLQKKVEHCLATMACHRQIRAGDRLNREEMTALLGGLEGTPRSYHCPHGRPVMVEIAKNEIEKWFKRSL